MNQSNLYNYSIITGVWNDLDLDVLLLVKEYLEYHLDRRLLNKDYNVFLETIQEKEKNTPLYCRCNEDVVTLTRVGLKSHKRSGWVTSFKKKIYYQKFHIDDFIHPRYYINNIPICLNHQGFTDLERIHFLSKYENLKNDDTYINYEDNFIMTQLVRMIMDDEERSIQS